MTFPQRLLNEGEHVVVHTRTHPKAMILPVLGAVVIIALAIVASGLLPEGLWWIAVAVVACLALGYVFVLPLVRWLTTTYTFTNRRFLKRSGFIAKEGRTIPLNRISGVDFEIGVLDRLFGCGTLVVSDASTNGRVELDDIPEVEAVQLKVSDQLHRLSRDGRADDGT